ncbi:unnamed protein product [Bemisia tabaci]|uniref:Glucose-methanol-choline oxidoreductase N-terminal domain-containing protein n=1 Tax=Bemisia tabaci TaxID=7038 RepID=A0A9P0C6M6_BEMTA|nr:unnamed protein product [Bemisia tabaci]
MTMLSTVRSVWWIYGFDYIFAVMLAFYSRLHPYPGTNLMDVDQLEPEYDFIIIGAGSAGSILANRLSEEVSWRVLVLEAGDHETPLSEVPGLSHRLRDTSMDWQYRTAPPHGNQSYCLAMNDLSCKWPRGRVVGGSSVLNSLLYVRGNRRDYDRWARMGNVGWGFDDVLKYFLKSEDNANPDLVDTEYHAAGGYLSVQDLPYVSPVADSIIEAAKSRGYENLDINGRNQTGFTIAQVNLRNGKRCSVTKAFIIPAANRPNLHISQNSFVTKLNFDSQRRAKSVTFTKNGVTHTIKSKKEIILSAGSIGSPQILMLSGIGPRKHLKQLNIQVVKNLRVGYNLQDHVGTIVTYRTDAAVTLKPADILNERIAFEYFTHGDGPLTSPGGFEILGFINTEHADSSGSYPDVPLILGHRVCSTVMKNPSARNSTTSAPTFLSTLGTRT